MVHPDAAVRFDPARRDDTSIFYLHNTALVPRTITSVTVDGAQYAVHGLLGRTMASGETVPALAVFEGTQLGRADTGVTITFDDGTSLQNGFTGTVHPRTYAIRSADSTPDDGWLDFGPIARDGGAVERAVTIRNPGTTPLVIQHCALAPEPGPGFGLGFELVGPCPSEVPAGAERQLVFRFTPSTLGKAAATALVQTSTTSIYVPLRATVTTQAYRVSAAMIELTGQTSPRTATITVTNASNAPLTLPITVDGTGFTAPSSVTIAAMSNADVVVTYRAKVADTRRGLLVVGDVVVPLVGRVDGGCVLCGLTGSSADVRADGPRVLREPDETLDEDEPDGGCSAGGASSTAGAIFGLVALASRLRRHRRRDGRARARRPVTGRA